MPEQANTRDESVADAKAVDRATTTEDDRDTPTRTRRDPLTRERVIRAAMRVMDDEGLEALTMRRIGRELGVEAMSLYNHVEDKEEILEGICEVVMGGFEFPQPSNDWTEEARRAARSWRSLLKAHPNVITLLSERRKPMTSPQALRPMEHALDILRRAGLSERDAVAAFNFVGAFIFGFVLMEVGKMFGGETTATVTPEELAGALPAQHLPRFFEMLPYLIACDLEESFEFGLDVIMAGLQTKIAG